MIYFKKYIFIIFIINILKYIISLLICILLIYIFVYHQKEEENNFVAR